MQLNTDTWLKLLIYRHGCVVFVPKDGEKHSAVGKVKTFLSSMTDNTKMCTGISVWFLKLGRVNMID